MSSEYQQKNKKEAGNSLPAQIERIRKYCERKGFEVTGKDILSFDESVYKEKRDDFDTKIIARIEEIIKKEKVAVCFDKVDRLARNVFDKRVAYLYQLALEGKIELYFVYIWVTKVSLTHYCVSKNLMLNLVGT